MWTTVGHCALQHELDRQDKYPNLVEPHRLKALLVSLYLATWAPTHTEQPAPRCTTDLVHPTI